MLEVKTTGNVGTCRLVAAAGKTPVLNISLATNRKVGDREFTDWSSVKIWGERGQKLAPFITKGTKLLISGRPEARAYKGTDGLAKAELVIHASDVEFLSGQGQNNAAGSEPQHTEEEAELPLGSAA
jgi:single-strand DNA-binding protein